jgi:RNA polymerase sigma-70 factor, ECF subfamily
MTRSPLEDLTTRWTAAQPAVAAFISAAIPNFHDAQDVLQEVALAIAQSYSQYDPARPFTAWAIGVAHHKVLNFFGRTVQKRGATLDPATLETIAGVYVQCTDEFLPVQEALQHCMQGVAGKSRKILNLRYQEGLKSATIAQRLGLTVSTVDVTFHRIRMALRDCIEKRLAAKAVP